MKENNSFLEKWKDKKYQAKIKLSGYGIFVVIIIIILLFGQGDENIENNDNNIDDNVSFTVPNTDNYEYEIEIISNKDNKNEVIKYLGTVVSGDEEIIKKENNLTYNYKIVDDKYYKLDNNNYVLTTINEVYGNSYNYYLNIDSINNYLSLAVYDNNVYKVFVKDIILNNNSDKYIEISLNKYDISIDYTNLFNVLNNDNYDSYIVNIKYK